MIMADVLKIFFLVIGSLIIVNCYWLLAEGLFPRFVERARKEYETRAIRKTFFGALVAAPCVLFGLFILDGLSGHPLGATVGGAFVLGPILLGILGSSGLAQRVGMGLPSPVDESQPWKRVLRGGVVLSITFLFPFVGWFVVIPLTLVSGFGAGISAIRKRESDTHPSAGLDMGAATS